LSTKADEGGGVRALRGRAQRLLQVRVACASSFIFYRRVAPRSGEVAADGVRIVRLIHCRGGGGAAAARADGTAPAAWSGCRQRKNEELTRRTLARPPPAFNTRTHIQVVLSPAT